MKYLKHLFVLILLSFFISACELDEILGESEVDGNKFAPVDESKFSESDEEVNVTSQIAMENVEASLQKMTDRLEEVSNQVNAIDSAESLSGDGLFSLKPGSSSPRLAKILKGNDVESRILSKITEGEFLSKLNGQELSEDVEHMFAEFLIIDEENRSGNVIPYNINPDLCLDEFDAEDQADCETVLKDVRIIQKLNSEIAGTLELHYSTSVLVIVGYSDDEWYVEVSLDDFQVAMLAINQIVSEPEDDLPETLKGAMRTTIKLVGEEDVVVISAITRDIKIVAKDSAEDGGEEFDISVSASKVAEMSTVLADEKVTVTFNLGSVDFLAKIEEYTASQDEHADHMHKMFSRDSHIRLVDVSFGFDGFSGTIEFDGKSEALNASDLGLKSDMVMKEDGKEIMRLHMPAMSFVLSDPASDESHDLEFLAQSDINISINSVDDSEGVEEEFSLAINVEDGTRILNYPGDYDSDWGGDRDITKVASGGPVTIEFSEADPVTFTANEGECFRENDADGFELVDCPSA